MLQEDDSDSDTECALSEYWSFQRESRRWSRNRDVSHITPSTTSELLLLFNVSPKLFVTRMLVGRVNMGICPQNVNSDDL